jgi:hypothetical protein
MVEVTRRCEQGERMEQAAEHEIEGQGNDDENAKL